MNLKPINDRILVKVAAEKELQVGKIIIPVTTAENAKHRKGVVMEVGPGRLVDTGEYIPLSVKVNDFLIFFGGIDFSVGGMNYTLLQETEVIALIRE